MKTTDKINPDVEPLILTSRAEDVPTTAQEQDLWDRYIELKHARQKAQQIRKKVIAPSDEEISLKDQARALQQIRREVSKKRKQLARKLGKAAEPIVLPPARCTQHPDVEPRVYQSGRVECPVCLPQTQEERPSWHRSRTKTAILSKAYRMILALVNEEGCNAQQAIDKIVRLGGWTMAELVAFAQVGVAMSGEQGSTAAAKEIREVTEGKMPERIEWKGSLDVNVRQMTDEQLDAVIQEYLRNSQARQLMQEAAGG